MTIQHKIMGGFLALVCLIGAVGLYSVYSSSSILGSYIETPGVFHEEITAAIEAQSYAKRAEGHLFLYLMFGDEADREKFFQRYDSLVAQQEIMNEEVTTTGGLRELAYIKSNTSNLRTYGEMLLKEYDKNPGHFDFKFHKKLVQQFHAAARDVRQNANSLATRRPLDAAISISSWGKRAESHLFLYLNLGDFVDKDKFYQAYQALYEQYEILELSIFSPSGKQALNKTYLAINNMIDVGNELIAVYEQDKSAFHVKNYKPLIEQFHTATSAIRTQGVYLATSEKELIGDNIALFHSLTKRIQIQVLIVVALSVIIALLISYFLARKISLPLANLANAIRRLSDGEYMQLPETNNVNDEISIMATSFNKLTSELEKHHNEFDELVKERTREYIKANKRYEAELNERKKIQEQLIQTQKMDALGHLAAGIAHDFNNVLNAISGYTELAMFEAEPDGSVQNKLQSVRDASVRASRLVDQILTFSKEAKTELVPIKVKPVMEEVYSLLQATIPSTINIDLDCSDDAEDAVILGEQTKLNQVLLNIATNASHAMHDTGGNLRITARIENNPGGKASDDTPFLTGENFLSIEISDSGHGIQNENLGRIFDPYFTTKDKGEGTGLGLAVVHGIVESFNGRIHVKSKVGKGTTFKVSFPLVDMDIDSIGKFVPQSMPGGHEHILVVDDDDVLAHMYAETLEKLGYAATVRTSSVEALQLFENRPGDFDLVLSDLTMPNLSGLDLAREMLLIRPSLPIVLITGYATILDSRKTLELGIKGLLHKPLLVQDLAVMIRKLLDGNEE